MHLINVENYFLLLKKCQLLQCLLQYVLFLDTKNFQLKDNGKPGKKGVVALERKLLVLIYTVYKNGRDYNPDHR